MGPIGWIASPGQQAAGYVCGGLCCAGVTLLLALIWGLCRAAALGERALEGQEFIGKEGHHD